jgi:hypothetical protein
MSNTPNTDRIRNEIIDLLPCHARDIPNCETPSDCYKCSAIIEWANKIISIKGLWVEAEQDKNASTDIPNGDVNLMEGFIKVEKKESK